MVIKQLYVEYSFLFNLLQRRGCDGVSTTIKHKVLPQHIAIFVASCVKALVFKEDAASRLELYGDCPEKQISPLAVLLEYAAGRSL
jgi:hypothetical protein